jgi:hydroxyethylthiazole kinase-like uncharacterized protein yjeF
MIRAHAVDAVRAAEAAAMAGLPEGELMARAARGLADVAAARLADIDEAAVVGLIGAGDNGGDTLYAAALLSDAGFPCAVVLLPSRGRDGVHAAGLAAAEEAGVRVHVAAEAPEAAADVVAEADLVLDGIVGIGGRPGLRPAAAALVDAIDDDAWVIAVDVASGLDPSGEEGEDDAVWADETVTFGTPKPAHLLPPGEAASGRLTVVDIGIDVTEVAPAVERLTWDDVARLWPVPDQADDKYSRGVLGVVAGCETYPGAAVLCTTGAAEAGVGMIRYLGTPTPVSLVRTAVPEAVVGPGRVQAWVVGPGLDVPSGGLDARSASQSDPQAGGQTDPQTDPQIDPQIDPQPHQQTDQQTDPQPDQQTDQQTDPQSDQQLAAAREALASDLPVIVDAGGLDLVAGRREAPTVLTPHAGELARLLTRLERAAGQSHGGGDGPRPGPGSEPPETTRTGTGDGAVSADDVRAAPLRHARRLADLTGATVLLKGSTTLVVTGGMPVRSQADAPPWLATAGAGDVLSGVIGALLAAGLAPHDAAALGALVHGVAADRVSGGGPLRALSVAHGIRAAVRDLLVRGRAAPR